jgi:hypothetical protein
LPGIDLHTHSTASDGTLKPAELVRAAKNHGLDALALTDHDTIAGNAEALAEGKRQGVEVIAGCELSVEYKPGFMHILGLFVPDNPERLLKGMSYLNERRESRNTRMVDKLREIGVDITYQELLDVAAGGTVGRPHLARALMNRGYVDSMDQAFAEYLGKNGKAYLPKEKFTPEQAIGLLASEGATVVLAHPYSLGLSTEALRRELSRLKDMGLGGIECVYPLHDASQTRNFTALADELGLLVTGGSDFHGSNKPEIILGMTRNGKPVPYELLAEVKNARAGLGLPV